MRVHDVRPELVDCARDVAQRQEVVGRPHRPSQARNPLRNHGGRAQFEIVGFVGFDGAHEEAMVEPIGIETSFERRYLKRRPADVRACDEPQHSQRFTGVAFGT